MTEPAVEAFGPGEERIMHLAQDERTIRESDEAPASQMRQQRLKQRMFGIMLRSGVFPD